MLRPCAAVARVYDRWLIIKVGPPVILRSPDSVYGGDKESAFASFPNGRSFAAFRCNASGLRSG